MIVVSVRRAPAEGAARDPFCPGDRKRRYSYNADLDRFFLDLPLNGVRSPHSLRAYGYDVMLWIRFLEEACGKSVGTLRARMLRPFTARVGAKTLAHGYPPHPGTAPLRL